MTYARTLRRSMLPHLRPDGNQIIESDAILHPTKGWRHPSVKSAHAHAITFEVRRGLRPWSSVALREILKQW